MRGCAKGSEPGLKYKEQRDRKRGGRGGKEVSAKPTMEETKGDSWGGGDRGNHAALERSKHTKSIVS